MSERNDDRDEIGVNLKTNSELVTRYLRSMCGSVFTESTAKTYCSFLRGYIRFLADRSLSIFTAEDKDVLAYMKLRAQNGRRQRTIAGDKTAITGLYKWIRLESDNDAQIDYLFLKSIDPSRFLTPPPIEREALDPDELNALYDAFETRRDRLIATTGVETGGRSIDLRELRIDDVDFGEQEIVLPDQKTGGTNTIPISDVLATELKHWLKICRPIYNGSEDHDYLFPSNSGDQLAGGYLLTIVQNAAEKAGIQEVIGETRITEREREVRGVESDVRQWKKVNVHVLRHTFNRILEDAGLPLKSRRDALNHECSETTEKYYSSDSTEYKDLIRDLLHDNQPSEED